MILCNKLGTAMGRTSSLLFLRRAIIRYPFTSLSLSLFPSLSLSLSLCLPLSLSICRHLSLPHSLSLSICLALAVALLRSSVVGSPFRGVLAQLTGFRAIPAWLSFRVDSSSATIALHMPSFTDRCYNDSVGVLLHGLSKIHIGMNERQETLLAHILRLRIHTIQQHGCNASPRLQSKILNWRFCLVQPSSCIATPGARR